MTDDAVELLNSKNRDTYRQLRVRSADLQSGTHAEDLDFRFTNHFYYPPTRQGLFIGPLAFFSETCDRQIGSMRCRSARQRLSDERFFENAISLYKAGDVPEAYIAFGHVLHLAAQDMFSVPHVSDDMHFTAQEEIPFQPRFANFTRQSYESWVKDSYLEVRHNRALNPYRKGLVNFPSVPESIEIFLHNNAAKTFETARIEGDLKKDPDAPATGRLATMFPPDYKQEIELLDDCHTVNPVNGACLQWEKVWRIAEAGDCRELTGLVGKPTLFEHWWRSTNFTGDAKSYFYFERPRKLVPYVYDVGGPRESKNLAELWALDREGLVAQSQLASAALMKEFAKRVDPIPPNLTIRKGNASGSIVTPGGVAGRTVYIAALDPQEGDPGGSSTYPVASGVFDLLVTKIDVTPHQRIESGIGSNGLGRHGNASHIFEYLNEGEYVAYTMDGLGNETSVYFTVAEPPKLKKYTASYSIPGDAVALGCGLFCAYPNSGYDFAPLSTQYPVSTGKQSCGESCSSVDTVFRAASFQVASVAGLASASLTGPSGSITIQDRVPSNPAGAHAFSGNIRNLPPGAYTLNLTDSLGQQTHASWRVESLKSSISSVSSSTLNSNGTFSGNVTLALTGSQNLISLEQVDKTSGLLLGATGFSGLSGQASFHLETSSYPQITTQIISTRTTIGANGPALFILRDSSGNAIQGTVSAALRTYADINDSYPWTPTIAPTTATVVSTSALYDLMAGVSSESGGFSSKSSLLPGAVMQVGLTQGLISGSTFRRHPVSIDYNYRSVTLPVDPSTSCVQIIGSVKVDLLTGSTTDHVDTLQNLMNADIDYGTGFINKAHQLGSTNYETSANVTLPRYFKLAVTYSTQTAAKLCLNSCDDFFDPAFPPATCTGLTATPSVVSVGAPIGGQVVTVATTPALGTPAAAGNDQAMPLAYGLRASGVDVAKAGVFLLEQTGEPPVDRGFVSISSGTGFSFSAMPQIKGTFQLSVPYDTASYTTEQLALARAYAAGSDGSRTRLAVAVSSGMAEVTYRMPGLFRSSDPEIVFVEVPAFADPLVIEKDDLRIVAALPGVDDTAIVGPPSVSTALAALQYRNLWLEGRVYQIDFSSAGLDPPAIVKLPYDPARLASQGVDVSGLQIVAFSTDGTHEVLLRQIVDTSRTEVTAQLSSTTVTPYLALFATPPETAALSESSPQPTPPPLPTAPSDTRAPRTEVVVEGPSVSSGTLYVGEDAQIGLSAVDDYTASGDEIGAGVAQTYVATGTGTYGIYDGPRVFESEGAVALRFFSVDSAGHYEAVSTVTVAADFTPPATTLTVSGSSRTDSEGRLVFVGTAPVTLAAVDPLSGGVASGADAIYYVIDSDPFSAACLQVELDTAAPAGTCANELYDGSFKIPPGERTLYYLSEDALGNQEELHSVRVLVQVPNDVRPPRTTLTGGVPSASSTTFYGKAGTSFRLSAVDDLTAPGDGAGLAANLDSRLKIDGGSYDVSSTPFLVSGEGSHTLMFFSVDALFHEETPKTRYVIVDLSTPSASFQTSGSSGTNALGGVLIATGTTISLSATDPTSNGVASGTSTIHFLIDTATAACAGVAASTSAPAGSCANSLYAAPFSLSTGAHVLRYYAYDVAGNLSVVRSTSLTVQPYVADVKPPRSVLNGVSVDDSTTSFYSIEGASFSISSTDDWAIVADSAGVGGMTHYVSTDAGPFGAAGSFSLIAEGPHQVRYYSVDSRGNAESTKTATIVADFTPPQSFLGIFDLDGSTAPAITISSGGLLGVVSGDPVSGGAASGLRAIYYIVDLDPESCGEGEPDPEAAPGTCENPLYSGPFSLAAGTHTVYLSALDRAGNSEEPVSVDVTVVVDTAPPRSTLSIGSSTSAVYASSRTLITLSAVDDRSYSGDGAGVGGAFGFVAVDTTTYLPYDGAFSLSTEGAHSIGYFSRDVYANFETTRVVSVGVDLTAPSASFVVTGASAVFSPTSLAVSTASGIGFSANDPVSSGVASGIGSIWYAVDDATNSLQAFSSTFTLSAGTHSVRFFARDAVGNTESTRAVSVEVQNYPLDGLPPRTYFAAGAPSWSTSTLYAAAATTFSLTAFDDAITIGDASGKGVDRAYVKIDTGSYALYSGTFSIPSEGTHTVTFYSIDVASRAEVAKSSAVTVDLTAPQTILSYTGPARLDGGTLLISTTTRLILTASDPVSHGAASGVDATLYAVDEATYPTVYASSFTLAAGTHTLYYFAVDRVRNEESVHELAVDAREDALAPRTELVATASSSTVGGVYVSSGAVLSLSAADDLSVSGDAAGQVTATYLSIGGTGYSLYAGTFSFPAEGSRVLHWYSVDWTGRVESVHSATVTTDRTSPATTLDFVGYATTTVTGVLIVSTEALVALSTADAASGVALIEYGVDEGDGGEYAGPFSLSAGTHTIQYRSTDRVGNVEEIRSTNLEVQARPFDALPARSQISVSASFTIPGRVWAKGSSSATLTAADDGLAYGDAAGGGVAQILVGVDTTTLSSYSAPFAFASEGPHVLRYRAVDAGGRYEAVRSTTVYADFSAPVTTLSASPSGLEEGTLYVLADYSPVTLTPADPDSAGASSGLELTEYAVDAGTAAAYAGPFTLSAGDHTLYYRSRDRLGNQEAWHVQPAYGVDASSASDTTAPEAAIVSLVDGSTLTALATITGTAADDVLVFGLELAARDLDTGEWWDGAASTWTSSGPVYRAAALADVDSEVTWSVDVGSAAAGAGFGAFSGFLTSSHTYRVYARASDYAGHSSDASESHFVWRGATNSYVGPGQVLDLAAQSTGYRSIVVAWSAPGANGNSGRAASYELRVATFPFTSLSFSLGTVVPTPVPSPAGSSESAAFNEAESGRTYYFLLLTRNAGGQTSEFSNSAHAYSGDHLAALDGRGRLWQLSRNQNAFSFSAHDRDGFQIGQYADSKTSGFGAGAIGFDVDGGAYAFLPVAGAPMPGKPTAVLYRSAADGTFVSSSPYYGIGGQRSALNLAPGLAQASSMDTAGKVWIAGDAGTPGQYAGLWRADAGGLNLVGLSPAATPYAVLSLAEGRVWMAGTDGELAFWRHDVASGETAKYRWTNTLGGSGSAGKAVLEDVDGGVWIAGWARTATAKVAALWRWSEGSITLVAASTGTYGEEAEGLDLDAAGKFWLSGRSTASAEGTPSLALWSWQSPGGGSDLALSERRYDVPPKADFAAGQALTVSQGRVWALAGPSPYGARSRALETGSASGTARFADGFAGGALGFFVSEDPLLDAAAFHGLADAAPYGTESAFELDGLPAPGTYYFAVIYDQSGTLASGAGEPGGSDPIGFAFTPVFVPAGGSGTIPPVTLGPDAAPPSVSILSPVDGSTTTTALFSISGTASDDRLAGDLRVGLERLSDGKWWDGSSQSFVDGGPRLELGAARSGRADSYAWASDLVGMREALTPGASYRVHAAVSDLSGGAGSASAAVVLISSTNPTISTYGISMAMSRDAAGNFWLVSQDQKAGQPFEYVLRKYDATGLALSSTTLSGGGEEGSYGIGFDSSGNAWVAGSAEQGGETKVAVWKVAAAGGTLLSSATAGGAYGTAFAGGVAVDSSGNAWVPGAESTGEGLSFRHALWKFSPAGALAAGYPKTYPRSGGTLDAALASAIDASGSVWSAGVSSNPATGRLDLAVWKHGASGALAGGFPAYLPSAFASVESEGGVQASVAAAPSGGVWVAASRSYLPFDASDLVLLRYDDSGALVSSSVWHASGYAHAAGAVVALDPAGAPYVLGKLRPAPYGSTSALWKYSAAGVLASGYPLASALVFDSQSLAVDGAGTPWVVSRSRPEVFGGTETVAGASGPGFYATAGVSSISGMISIAGGLAAGTTVTIAASRDRFDGEPEFAAVVSTGGAGLPYSIALLAPATWQLLAFVGEDPESLSSATPVGSYAGFAGVALGVAASVAGADFSLRADTTPPTSAITGFVSGSTLTALATILGSASDDTALIGPMLVAARDLDTGLWWDAAKQDWVVSASTLFARAESDATPGNLDARSWILDASAGSSEDSGLGGLSDFLPYGHSFELLEKQIDIAGNVQAVPAVSSFVWRGAAGAAGPPETVDNLTVAAVYYTSASVNWTAPGEHQNIGRALSYDLRYTSETAYNFVSYFSTYAAAAGLPDPPIAGFLSSHTLTGLLPGKRYRVALKTLNHEEGLSGLSNVPLLETLTPHVPPRTSLAAGAPSYSGASLYATAATTMTLSAVDDLIAAGDGVGEGVATTYVRVDTTTYSVYHGETISLSSEGVHSIGFYSVDAASNVETASSRTVAVDLTSPFSSLAVAGSSVTDAAGLVYSTAAVFSFSSSDPVSSGTASGVGAVLYAVDSGTEAAYASPFSLSSGAHTVYYRARDRVGNAETVHVETFTVQSAPFDLLPPRSVLQAGPSVSSSALYVSAVSSLGIVSVDDGLSVGDAAGHGVAQRFVAIDTTTYSLHSATFSLVSEGTHTLSYYAVDSLGRAEAAISTAVAVDATPPVTALAVSGSSAADSEGLLYYSTAAAFSLSAADPVSAGVAAGTAAVYYAVDAGTEAAYASTFTLTAGAHTVYYRAVDRVANAEAVRVATFTILTAPFDVLPPRTSLSASPSFSSGPVYVTTFSALGLSATDDGAFVGDAAGGGAASILLAVDATAYSLYAATFSLVAEGTHTLSYYAIDVLGRAEAAISTTVAVDSTRPSSQLQVSGSSMVDSGRVVISTDALVSLSASDPSSGGVASGVGSLSYGIDSASTAAYSAPFALSAGTHVVRRAAADRAGNREAFLQAALWVQERPFDVRPPRSVLVVGTPSYSTTTIYATTATPLDLDAVDDALSVGDGLGKGAVGGYVSVDGGAYAAYTGPFNLSGGGAHTISYQAYDADGSLEVPHATSVAVDLTPPAASLVVTGFSVVDGGRVLVSTNSAISVTGSDPVSSGVASGFATGYYAIDAGTETAFGSPFVLSVGTHTIYYRAADRVANIGTVRIASFTAVIPDSTTAPSPVVDLVAAVTAYHQIKLNWSAPGDVLGSGQALEYDLRVSTSSFGSDAFFSKTRVATPEPSPAGSFETANFDGAEPGKTYYFLLRTYGHSGQPSPVSNLAATYTGVYTAAVAPDGRLWLLHDDGAGFNLARFSDRFEQEGGANHSLPWTTTSRALGFDAEGGAYVFQTVAAPYTFNKPRAVLYRTAPDGVFLSSRPLDGIGGQQSALNEAPSLVLATSVDADGVVWVGGDAGAPGQKAGLWRIDSSGLNLAALSAGASVHAVLALGGGPVWMTGGDGELVFWRHDPGSGDMTRYHWTSTLGGAGSAGRGMVEDTLGRVWIGGWAVSGGVRRAALWRWEDGSISLVALSTGAYGDEAYGLDLDAGGRFWLSGRSVRDGAGTAAQAFWTYQSVGGGSNLVLAGVDAAPPTVDFAFGNALALAHGKAWGLAGPPPYGAASRTLGYGVLTGTVTYAGGFSGGNVAFFLSRGPEFHEDVALQELQAAPGSGTTFSFALNGLPAPATYYVAAIYDLSGSVAESGEPGSGDPIGFSAKAFLASDGSASAGSISVAADASAPELTLLSPLAGSTVPVSALEISGTANDDRIVTDIKVGIHSLAEDLWWNSGTGRFEASGEPLMDVGTRRSGTVDAASWSVDMKGLREALRPGFPYRVHAEALDLGGHATSTSAAVVVISTTNPSISTQAYALTMSRDAAGSFWLVSQDQKGGQPEEFILRKYDATGLALASTTLSGAASEGSYGIAFDSSGNAWVAGSASADDELKLAVWKIASGGGTMLASATFSGSAGAAFSGGVAVDGSDGVWIAGVEATGEGPLFKHGLWKYTSGAALVSGYPKYFQRSGGTLDGALSAAIDASGNVWSAGVSSNPANGRLDLAVWKHDSSGALAGGFPLYRSAAFTSVEGEGGVSAAIAVSPSGAVWVAGSQSYPPFEASDLSLDHYDLSGALVSSSVWHATGYPSAQAKALALDPSGNPVVLGSLRPAPYGSAQAVWKYAASGALAAGYPKASAMSFDGQALAVDGAGTAWVVSRARPEVFQGTETVAGAPVPGYFASAAYSTITGTITYAAGLTAGTTVTLIASADGFHAEPSFFALAAPGGSSVPYSARLLAPATWQLFAFVGTDPDQTNPILGGYAGFASLPVYATASVSGVSFSLFLDTTPPVSAFSFASGSTFTALATIRGTAADDGAVIGPMRLAAMDLDTGLWWDAVKQDWVASTTTLYRLLSSDGAPGRLDARAWSVDAAARRGPIEEADFGGFSDFLPYGHSFVLYEKQIDFAGNEQSAPVVSSFVWRGASGAYGPPDAVSDLSFFDVHYTSVTARWAAPGEHQNIGRALSFDLRVTTETAYDFSARFSSYTAFGGLPEPPYVGSPSTFTLTGLIPGRRYRGAIKTLNHEGGVSALSNIPFFDMRPASLLSITVSPSSASIDAGTTVQFTASGYFEDGSTRALGVAILVPAWSSDAPSIATVTAAGLATAVATGTAHLTVSSGSVSATADLTVLLPAPSAAGVSPSSAPIGAPFTVSGAYFGVYASSTSKVKIGGVEAPVTSWSDTSIEAAVPGALSTGAVSIVVERWAGASVSSSNALSFLVLLPEISTLDPVAGPVDTVVTVTGGGFGPYDGDATTLLVGGSSVAVSVWNDHEIVWTVPADLSPGDYPVVVRRSPSGGAVESSSATFTVDAGMGGGSFMSFRGAQPLAVRPDKHFRGSLRLTRAAGGAVRAPAKVAALVPAGALPDDAEVALRRVAADPLRTAAADDLRARAVGEAIEFGPEGTRFDAPVTLEIPYDPELAGADARGAAIHYFNPLRRAWEALPTRVDAARKVLIAETDHFSIYQPLGLGPTTAAQDEFYYRDHYAFPSPSRAGAPVVFRLQPGLAETVEVRVYDAAGRKLHESSDFTFLGAFDDGNGKGAQNTYDHSWSVSGIGSGVYQYVLKASRAGFKPIVKTGKVGVIK